MKKYYVRGRFADTPNNGDVIVADNAEDAVKAFFTQLTENYKDDEDPSILARTIEAGYYVDVVLGEDLTEHVDEDYAMTKEGERVLRAMDEGGSIDNRMNYLAGK